MGEEYTSWIRRQRDIIRGMYRHLLAIALCTVVAPLPLAAQTAAPAGAKPKVETAGPAEEKTSQTSHTLRLDGRDIKYTATAGTLPIRLDNGQIAARMFFVDYTRDGEDAKTRPLSFLYHGGPGAATIWLHMGSSAPKRVAMADEGFQPAPPYRLVDNESSLLDVTDMVYVDAVDTGFSRVVAGVNNQQFHGVRGDLRAFGEFINNYLKAYSRFPSPKYLIGESYGTIRSAGLAQELQNRHGIELNGITMLSSTLSFQNLLFSPQNDVAKRRTSRPIRRARGITRSCRRIWRE